MPGCSTGDDLDERTGARRESKMAVRSFEEARGFEPSCEVVLAGSENPDGRTTPTQVAAKSVVFEAERASPDRTKALFMWKFDRVPCTTPFYPSGGTISFVRSNPDVSQAQRNGGCGPDYPLAGTFFLCFRLERS